MAGFKTYKTPCKLLCYNRHVCFKRKKLRKNHMIYKDITETVGNTPLVIPANGISPQSCFNKQKG